MIGGLLLFAGLLLCGAIGVVRRAPAWWLGMTLAGAVGLLAAAAMVLGGAPAWSWQAGWTAGGEHPRLFLDAVGALFLALLAVVGAAGAIYSRGYWTDRAHPSSAARGRLWWSVLMLAMSGVFLSANGLQFLVCWELFTVAAFFLLMLESGRVAVRRAGWLYLAASHVGTLALFAFFTLLAVRTGGWELGPWRERGDLK